MPAIRYGKAEVVAQAVMAGEQRIEVRAFGRRDGWPKSYISVRLGNILLNIEDRAALSSLIEATRAAAGHSEQAFASATAARAAPSRQTGPTG
jgi:hypothetical protein